MSLPVRRDDRKYVRVYYDILREYPDICADVGAFGLWVRLLMMADSIFPGVPSLPRLARPRDLTKLVDAGLVTISGDTFTLRGLEAERARRGASARNAAAVRWHSERSASGDPVRMPRRDETRRDEVTKRNRESLEGAPWNRRVVNGGADQ